MTGARKLKLELWLTRNEPYELDSIVIEHPELPKGRSEAVRAKISRVGTLAFEWRQGAAALTVLFVRYAAFSLRPRLNDSVRVPRLEGRRGSAAASLSDALDSGTLTFCGGDFVRRLIERRSSIQGAKRQFSITLKDTLVSAMALEVYLGEALEDDPNKLDRVADAIEAMVWSRPRPRSGELDIRSTRRLEGAQTVFPSGGLSKGAPRRATSIQEQHQVLTPYLERLLTAFDSIWLPLNLSDGARVPLKALAIDLPLRLVQASSSWLAESHSRGTHQERAQHPDDGGLAEARMRVWRIAQCLALSSPLVITGAPGTGKSTLFACMVHDAARIAIDRAAGGDASRIMDVPVVLVCRDLAAISAGTRLETLLSDQLSRWAFEPADSANVVDVLASLLRSNKGTLLVDGVDELATPACRRELCRIVSQWSSMTRCRVIMTARTAEFQAIKDEFRAFEVFAIAPLGPDEKAAYTKKWLACFPSEGGEHLTKRVCGDRRLVGLCERIHNLALVAQAHAADGTLPDRELELYRRLIELLLKGQGRGERHRPRLEINEVCPHLEALGFRMCARRRTRMTDTEIAKCFEELRSQLPAEDSLSRRTPNQLVDDIVSQMGVLSAIGTTIDAHGMCRQNIEFLHQSWQSYFASQAIAHGRTGASLTAAEAVDRALSGRFAELKVGEHLGNGASGIEYWRDIIMLASAAISDGPSLQATDMLLLAIAGTSQERPAEAQGRALLALEVLNTGFMVGERTFEKVMARVLGALPETMTGTDFEAAIRTLGGTPWSRVLKRSLLQAYRSSAGVNRNGIGIAYLLVARDEIVERQNAILSRARTLLRAGGRGGRTDAVVRILLELVEILFEKQTGKVECESVQFDAVELRGLLIECAMSGNAAIRTTALWALRWLLNTSTALREEPSVPWLSQSEVEIASAIIKDASFDDEMGIVYAAELISSRAGMERYTAPEHRNDWIYEMALVADGGRPQRERVLPKPAISDPENARVLSECLSGFKSAVAARRAAIILGRMGWFEPRMLHLLIDYAADPASDRDLRDEAILLLATSGDLAAPEALLTLLEKTAGGEYDLSVRALFGIIAIGPIDLMARELAKGSAAAGGYCREFAVALMGAEDARGQRAVQTLSDHSDQVIRDACAWATRRSQDWGATTGSRAPSLSHRGSGSPLQAASDLEATGSPAAKVIASKTVCILLVRGESPSGEKIFVYVAIRADKLSAFMEAQKQGTFYPEDFGVIIERGTGEPNPVVREKMTREYGFNHEAMLDIPHANAANAIAANIRTFANRPS